MKCTGNSKPLICYKRFIITTNIAEHLKNVKIWLLQSIMLLGVFVFQGCRLNFYDQVKNNQIDNATRQQIHALDDKLFEAWKTENVVSLKQMMPVKLIGPTTDKQLAVIESLPKSDSYKVMDEYYVRNTTTGVRGTIFSGAGENEYFIHYMVLAKETYVALLLASFPNYEMLITAMYGKYGNDWKLINLEFGTYALLHKTPRDLFDLAKQNYQKSYMIDALNYASLANALIRPANNLLQYKDENEIRSFYQKVMQEVKTKYQLLFTIEDINSKPKIFRIFPETKEGFYPVIQYLSTINLKDTVALKKENEKIRAEIGRIFPGIDKNNARIYYQAFIEIPAGKKNVQAYNFSDDITKNITNQTVSNY